MSCPFCSLPGDAVTWSSELSVAVRDQYPVSPGHTLVVPRRHVETYFDATPSEQADLWQGVAEIKRALDAELRPDGYNVGFNVGRPAGQTVMHLHVHVIPRFQGDMDDPRGGVRGVIPGKQKYEAAGPEPSMPPDPFGDLLDFLPGQESHLLPQLLRAMRRADIIDLLSAFVQPSGLALIEDELVDALARDAKIRLLTGDYLGITHPHALQRLYTLSTAHGNLAVRFFESGDKAFHPKAYLFRRGPHGIAFIGSSNLSRGALTDAVEWNLRATSSTDAATFARVVARFDALWNAPFSRPLTADVVAAYQGRVRVPPAPEPAAKAPAPNIVQTEVLSSLPRRGEKVHGEASSSWLQGSARHTSLHSISDRPGAGASCSLRTAKRFSRRPSKPLPVCFLTGPAGCSSATAATSMRSSFSAQFRRSVASSTCSPSIGVTSTTSWSTSSITPRRRRTSVSSRTSSPGSCSVLRPRPTAWTAHRLWISATTTSLRAWAPLKASRASC